MKNQMRATLCFLLGSMIHGRSHPLGTLALFQNHNTCHESQEYRQRQIRTRTQVLLSQLNTSPNQYSDDMEIIHMSSNTLNHNCKQQNQQKVRNQNKEKKEQKQHRSFDDFLTNEKQRLEKIIKSEKRRLQQYNNFLDTERNRYTKMKKQEKQFLSTYVDDGVVGDLASTLIRVDDSLQLSKRTSTRPTSQAGWTKLILDPIDTKSSNISISASSSTSAKNKNKNKIEEEEEEFVFLYEPPSRNPSMIIMFLGGAGLGQFPHITYSELLSRISQRLNAAIITAPYNIGLDHYELSKETGVTLHRALVQCQQSGRYSSTIPKFFLGHSLGSKLFTISTAAMNDILGKDLSGVGLISFNNFGFIETTKQVRTFAEKMDVPNSRQTTKMVDSILEVVEQAMTITGLEFTPSPKQTIERIIREKYDASLTSKTRLFVFDDDDLDSSYDFFKAVQTPHLLSVSGLPGNHLSPNFVKIDLDDIDVPEEARRLGIDTSSNMLQSISYGDEWILSLLVDEICSWVMGEDPSRGPHWEKQDTRGNSKNDTLLLLHR